VTTPPRSPVDPDRPGAEPGASPADSIWSAPTVAPDATSAVPARIGDYRIVRKIGEGGMGVVFEAEQQHPRRPVALKVILGGRYVDEHQVRLFQREAQTLARLKHPGIAAIYELGRTEEGQHFFTMELVRGDTLMQHLRKFDSGQDLTRDEVHRRLRLMQRVCDAVAYAHQRGVVHRDIKPANVLVVRGDPTSGSGTLTESQFAHQVKILDFGLAHITDTDVAVSTILSSAGAVQGTLPYMSPEQVRGNPDEIDLRTDVYSLGVMLYEMLARKLPLKIHGLSLPEAARVICEKSPEPIPRTLSGGERLDADVVTIVLKALEKNPARRYQSASAFADDIERYLSNHPILARPPSAMYQVQKLVARNRAAFVGGVAALLLLIAFAVTMTVQARRIATARDRAAAEAESARQVAEFLENLFQASDPYEAKGRTPTAREILDRGAARIDRELRAQPLLQARLLGTMGSIYQRLGDYREAERLLTASLANRRALLGNDHPDVADALMRLGVVADYAGRSDEALAHLRQALDIREKVLAPDDVDMGWSLYWLGATMGQRGEDHVSTRRSLERAASIFQARLGPNHWAVAWCFNDLGNSYLATGEFETAKSFFEKALEIKRVALGEEHPDTAIGMHAMANALTELKDYESARRLLGSALGIFEKVYGRDSDITASAYHSLGELLRRMGEFEAAREPLEHAVRVGELTLNPESLLLAEFLNSLALNLQSLGDTQAAEAHFARALSIRETVLSPDDRRIAETLEPYSSLLRATGRTAEADLMEARARAVRAKQGAAAPSRQ
jgi:eukaryotic-like serine/threonine-protein kinase